MNEQLPQPIEQPPSARPSLSGDRKSWIVRYLGWLLLLLAGGVAALFVLTAPEPKRRPAPPRNPLVVVEALAPASHCVKIPAHGRVEPVNRIKLVPQVSGRVVRVHSGFVPGGRVPAGEPLIVLEADEHRAARDQASAALKTTEEELRLERARHRTAVAELEQLGKRVTAEQRDLVTRGPQLRIKEAAVERARAALKRAELDLRRTRIRFGFPVVVESIAGGVGSVARAGETLGVAYPLQTLWVDVSLPVAALRWIAPRDRARVWSRASAAPYEGTVRELRPNVERQGSLGQLLVELSLPPAKDKQGRLPLRAGEFVRVELRGRCLERVFVLPRRAFRGEQRVWLAGTKDRLEIRRVEPVYVGADEVIVAKGLTAGERLITSQLERPVTGMSLTVDRLRRSAGSGAKAAGR